MTVYAQEHWDQELHRMPPPFARVRMLKCYAMPYDCHNVGKVGTCFGYLPTEDGFAVIEVNFDSFETCHAEEWEVIEEDDPDYYPQAIRDIMESRKV